MTLLVRHTEVARRWRGRCYGRLDVGLSREGARAVIDLIGRLDQDFAAIVHSGARRTRIVAEAVAARKGLGAICDPRWLERDFGNWEGQTWNAIYRTTGNAMDGMISDPAHFRPGGGETTFELRDRVVQAWRDLPSGPCLVVTHGGPIAAFSGLLGKLDVADWPIGQCGFGETKLVTSRCNIA